VPAHRSLICAHRGASAHLEDNSLAAFQAAIAMRADMIETDIRLGPSGDLVLTHDPVEDDRGLVRLAELIALARGRIRLDLELKEAGHESEALAEAGALAPGSFVSSFLPEVVARVAELAPQVPTALILGEDATGPPFELAGACGARAVAVEVSLLTPALLQEAARLRSPLAVWTVNDPATLQRLVRDPRVGIVITDVPDVAREIQLRTPPSRLPVS
jgi:glycerophosphoryl diester phosphodiesterase